MSTQIPEFKKKTLDMYLDEVNYNYLNSPSYMPSQFALTFMNFIKLVNGDKGESNKTPPMHLAMLDKIVLGKKYIANLCFRGSGKTTLFMEYFTLFVAFLGALPNFGKIEGMIYVSDSMDNGVKNARKNIEHRYNDSEFLQNWIPEAFFTDNYLEFKNKEGHKLGVKMFGAKTGIRGTKIFGKRPVLAILDDLISDDDAKSQAAMITIKDTVYKGVFHALDPQRRKVVLNGTPFNSEDIVIEAVESGAWEVNVWPVCQRWPCEREDFQGAWDDRFTYEFIKDEYEVAVKTGKLAAFYQELMLRLSSEDERLVQDKDIQWYSRAALLQNKSAFNFYITTDFATSKKQTADWSVISVWAYNAKGDWFWIDGICKKQTIDKSWDDLFRLVSEYQPQAVGVEVTGQQNAFIQYLESEMMSRNIWFTFALDPKTNERGLRPTVDKLSRFNLVVPWFKAGKIYFPDEMKLTKILGEFLSQIRLVQTSGIKGKDDCLDTISMLAFLKPWKPSESAPATPAEISRWEEDHAGSDLSDMASYVV